MTTIDWNRPLVTNAGKPARARPWHSGDELYKVTGDFGKGLDWWMFDQNGRFCGDRTDVRHVRNATPAEILAAPDMWPEWQEWARKEHVMANPFTNPDSLTAAERQLYWARIIANEQPDGVLVTRESLLAAVDQIGAIWEHNAAGGIERARKVFAPALATALGIPPEPQKQAPWEAACHAWMLNAPDDPTVVSIWQAAVDWCVAQMEVVVEDGPSLTPLIENIRRRIMGERP